MKVMDLQVEKQPKERMQTTTVQKMVELEVKLAVVIRHWRGTHLITRFPTSYGITFPDLCFVAQAQAKKEESAPVPLAPPAPPAQIAAVALLLSAQGKIFVCVGGSSPTTTTLVVSSSHSSGR
jgi:hypothetical protein